MADVLTQIFEGDAFGVLEMTGAINTVDVVPGFFGQNLDITEKGITTEAVAVEEQYGKINLIKPSERGSEVKSRADTKRKLRYFSVPHYTESDSITAAEVQGVRAFGSTNLVETVEGKRNEKLALMRASHELTHELARAGMIQGILTDQDGDPVQDWHSADGFNVARTTHSIKITDPTTDLRVSMIQAKRKAALHLGGYQVRGYDFYLTPGMYDDFLMHDSFYKMWERSQEGAMLRNDPTKVGIKIADDITVWCYEVNEYNGKKFLPEDKGFLVPRAPGLLQGRAAPADTIETANTIGLPFYAIPGEITKRKIEIETESNVVFYCEKPASIVNVTYE